MVRLSSNLQIILYVFILFVLNLGFFILRVSVHVCKYAYNNTITRVAQRTTKHFPISPIYFLPVLKRVQIYIGIQVPILVIAYTIW